MVVNNTIDAVRTSPHPTVVKCCGAIRLGLKKAFIVHTFFIMAGFAVFVWDTLKNSITKSTLWFFIVIASTITAVETIYLSSVVSTNSPIASIFSFTFDAHSSSSLFTTNQLFSSHP